MTRGDLQVQTPRAALVFLGSFVLAGAVPSPEATVNEEPVAVEIVVERSVAPWAAPHITLDASAPEDEGTVEGEVTEVRLFFSDAPLMRGASIRRRE